MLTEQEMMDRAVAGLASQGFERCVDSDNQCRYSDGNKRCAWGWVDTSLTTERGSVVDLNLAGTGLAAWLTDDLLSFAAELQFAHDMSLSPKEMREALRLLCVYHELVIPAALESHADSN